VLESNADKNATLTAINVQVAREFSMSTTGTSKHTIHNIFLQMYETVKIILHVKSPTLGSAKLNGFRIVNECPLTILSDCPQRLKLSMMMQLTGWNDDEMKSHTCNNNIDICIAPYGRNFRGAGPGSVLVGVRRGKRVSLREEKCL